MTDPLLTPDANTVKKMQWAEHLVDHMLDARRTENGGMAAEVTRMIYHEHDPELLLLVLASLATKAIQTEAQQHGPMLNLDIKKIREEAGAPPPELWQLAAADQMDGAHEAGDYATYAKLSVDGMIRSFRGDIENPEMDTGLEYAIAIMALLPQGALVLVAAEALMRLST